MFKLGVKLLIRSASIVNKSTLFILFMRVTVYLHYKYKGVFLFANMKHSADLMLILSHHPGHWLTINPALTRTDWTDKQISFFLKRHR